jgi:hypothetical protein
MTVEEAIRKTRKRKLYLPSRFTTSKEGKKKEEEEEEEEEE